MAGETTPEEALESLKTSWPAYFADPENAPPMPPVRRGLLRHSRRGHRRHRRVAAALAAGEVPYGVIAGAGSPMPWGQSARASAELSPRSFLTIVPAAGHFPCWRPPAA
jgi:pimeloyl-ACP methyl ester carboxylesterase